MKRIIPIIISFFVCLCSIMPMASFADEQTDRMEQTLNEIWDQVYNGIPNGQTVQNGGTNQKLDEMNQKLDNIDNQKEVTDYLDNVKDDEDKDDEADKIENDVKIDTSGSINKGLAVPRALATIIG